MVGVCNVTLTHICTLDLDTNQKYHNEMESPLPNANATYHNQFQKYVPRVVQIVY